MAIPRLLIDAGSVHGEHIIVRDAAAVHHLRNVLRLAVGAAVECQTPAGALYEGRIARLAPSEATVAVQAQRAGPGGGSGIILAPALIKMARFEWLVEKATELGVEALWPVVTERTVIRPSPDRAAQQAARWRRISEAAVKQCHGARRPDIRAALSFAQCLRQAAQGTLLVLPHLTGAAATWRQCAPAIREARRVLILIGPEGDFTEAEVAAAAARGAQGVSLGAEILRTETAALNAISVVRYLRSA